MAETLVIVESPAKAKTISKFLGKKYKVEASMGHVRDLPRSQFGVDLEDNFAPKYINIRGKGEILNKLRKAAKGVDRIYLATDPDREGEAISWHLAQILSVDPATTCRLEFNEITKEAVKSALAAPHPINMDLVDAQQARRILDRIVGYKISPLLWKKVKGGLSAGRVQSVAVRLVVERQAEIDAFEPEEYWSIAVLLNRKDGGQFTAELARYKGKKLKIENQARSDEIVAALLAETYTVKSITRKQRKRQPLPPFTTSTLQQEAFRRLNMRARSTMSGAQQLYEGLDIGTGTVGLITYMRTDSVRVAAPAQAEARAVIAERFGEEYLPPKPPFYRSKGQAQDAHEAIRPSDPSLDPETIKPYLKRDQYRLYKLIWERFIASQMKPALYDTISVEVAAGPWGLKANGSQLKFPGFLKVYPLQEEEQDSLGQLPSLVEGEELNVGEVKPSQHFTQPPALYTEASLIKTLEEQGIGRPSTYEPIIRTIQERGYVQSEKRQLRPTELGVVVVNLLKEHFSQIVDYQFTRELEEKLDSIGEGSQRWQEVLGEFYGPFSQDLEKAQSQMEKVQLQDEETDEPCPNCGKLMVIKHGRYGKFMACPGYPECKTTKPILKTIGIACPKCGGQIVERRSKRGRTFYGCDKYPQCDFTTWDQPTGKLCPKCKEPLVVKRRRGGATYEACSNKDCGKTDNP
jgi:DNA topoisomerase-1